MKIAPVSFDRLGAIRKWRYIMYSISDFTMKTVV